MGNLRDAILLVGPTGSGKTPAGDCLALRGIAGRACRHFDFGACFRDAAEAGVPSAPMDDSDIGIIRDSISTGALLTEDQFHVARKILSAFLEKECRSETDIVLLNGMPRHEGQARGIEDIIAVKCVLELSCTAETVMERIKLNTGGDRGGREDDLPELVERKLRIYGEQTRPLVAYYEKKGVPVLTAAVTVVSTAVDTVGAVGPELEKIMKLEHL